MNLFFNKKKLKFPFVLLLLLTTQKYVCMYVCVYVCMHDCIRCFTGVTYSVETKEFFATVCPVLSHR